ncbi:Mitogen-activated protein kinase kinase kinase 10 [Tetrabaena socialis]|uniref:Mitogen-activated protein kinase kinase kinase 10 n=1 Tax=Tetrabaena socialis TaxID=47790 RepID=A0A2J7ZV64_9CHLO|nr:Mitogen-activated protein kinase kinase kinase 10 [Tetrabaena socialis]|eukprot:PNH04150.1 Mitogen-activated protein kinase kinase kinase 10 [Tetrabaena socialis]
MKNGSAPPSLLHCLSSSDARSAASAAVITRQTPFRTGVCVDVALAPATAEGAELVNDPTDTVGGATHDMHGHGSAGAEHTAAKARWGCFGGRAVTATKHRPSTANQQPPTAMTARGASLPEGAAPSDVVRLLPGKGLLGKGAYGRVYEGEFCGQRVAVKLLCTEVVDAMNQSEVERMTLSFAQTRAITATWRHPVSARTQAFCVCVHQTRAVTATCASVSPVKQELDVLGRCEHPNIVRLLAACLQPPPGRPPCIVMECMDTSLDKLLYGRGELLPVPLVLHIAIEIARGLEYLHPTVLHRDLKPGNILINDPWGDHPVVKLSDFGLSRLRNTILATANPEAGTPAYLAPECFDVTLNVVTHKADIYAWGVVLWELLSGLRPWEALGIVAIAYQVSLLGQRLPVPMIRSPDGSASRWPPQLCQLLRECWDADPERRPAAAELAKRLHLLQQVRTGGRVLRRGSSSDA